MLWNQSWSVRVILNHRQYVHLKVWDDNNFKFYSHLFMAALKLRVEWSSGGILMTLLVLCVVLGLWLGNSM